MTVDIVIADDHPVVLDALRGLFALQPDFRVVASCVNGEEVLEAVRALKPHVVVLDLRMPTSDGLSVLRTLRNENLAARPVVFTAALSDDEVIRAIHLGARGVVLKDAPPAQLVECVRTVHAGGQFIEQRYLSGALDALLKREADVPGRGVRLTPRETEIVRLVATGLRNKEIAARLGVSEGTVKIHLHNIFEKVHVGTRVELTLYAQSRGLG